MLTSKMAREAREIARRVREGTASDEERSRLEFIYSVARQEACS